jgi:GGDEF domain-containing protein
VGVVLFGSDVFLSASDIIRRADSAMYKAKQHQRGSVVIWTQDLSADKG